MPEMRHGHPWTPAERVLVSLGCLALLLFAFLVVAMGTWVIVELADMGWFR